jgi:hypothetical protein
MTERWGGEPTEPIPGAGGPGGYGGRPDEAAYTRPMQPPTGGPPGRGGYDDPGRRRRRNWLIAGGVVAAVIIIVLIILLVTQSGGNSNGLDINSFNVPNTVNCTGPTTIGVSWTTNDATQVVLSIDGSIFRTYTGPSGADTVPFACNGATHSYVITAKNSAGAQTSQTQTVTQSSAPTTSSSSTTTTTNPPPTTSPPPPTTTTTSTTT